MADSADGSMLLAIFTFVREQPYKTAFGVCLVICAVTRLLTGIRFSSKPTGVQGSKTVPVIPYWIPWLGHAIPFGVYFQTYLEKLYKTHRLGAFALVLANTKHNIITSPSLAKQILLGRYSPVNMEQMILRVMNTFWNDHDTIRHMDQEVVFGPIHKALTGMMRESFVTSAIKDTVEGAEKLTWNLISGCESWVDQSVWERAGEVNVLGPNDTVFKKKGDSFVAEANLHHLLREFVGDIASTVLMGKNFMENYPNILSDLWCMDAQFNLSLLGLPDWFPGMVSAAAARERIIDAVKEHHDALANYMDGKDPGPRWNDMSDVSSVMRDRVQEWRAAKAPPRVMGCGDAPIFWALNVNANQVIFWIVWYVYADPRLLQELRNELKPFVKLRHAQDTGTPIKEAPRLDIDLQSLRNSCPLLNGTFFETMRLETGSASYKTVDEDFVITESEEDAAILGKRGPDSYLLRKGEFVCIPHGVHQIDEQYWTDPQIFDPRRFWTRETGEKGKEEIKVEYGTMKVWGGGKTMCKGKKFAESEVLLFAAAIIMTWEIEPVAGKWVHPGRKPSPSTAVPQKPVKVRMWRREGW